MIQSIDKLSLKNPNHPLHAWIILFNVVILTFIAFVLGNPSTSVADLTMQGALGINSTESQWIGIIYLISLASCVPLANWLADRYNFKTIFVCGTAIFLLSTLGTSLSTNFVPVLIFRTLEGVGGGAIMPLGLSLVINSFSQKRQSLAIALYTAGGFGISTYFGYLIGGYCAEYFYWQWIFLICFLIGLPCFFLSLWILPSSKGKLLPKFEVKGYLCFVITIASFIIYVSNVKQPWNTDGFTSYFAIGCLAIAFSFFFLFLFIELTAPHPLFNLRLFKNTSFCLGSISIVFIGIMFFGTLSIYPKWLESQLGYSQHVSGLFMAPFGAITAIISIVNSWLIRKVGALFLTCIGLLCLVGSCFYGQWVTMYSSHTQICLLIYSRALGVALSLAPVTTLALSTVPMKDSGDASVILTICRQVGGAFGGSMISLITVVREALHYERFGTQIDPTSAGFVNRIHHLVNYFTETLGYNLQQAYKLAHTAIIKDVENQSFTTGLADAFYIFGWIVLAILILLVISSLLRKKSPSPS